MSVVIRKGYGKRLKDSVVGAIIGVVLFFGAFFVLGWNERDAVRQTGAITEIDKVAIADVDSESIDDSNEDKLVHVAGRASTNAELEYRAFGVRHNAIRLRWDSSIYQWDEDRRETDDRVVYDYDQEWVDKPIDSRRFHDSAHSNDGSVLHWEDGAQQAQDVSFGAYSLPKTLINQIGGERRHALPESIAMDVQPAGTVHGGVFYTGDPESPKIGDEKVEVFVVDPQHDVTVLAVQQKSTFQPYMTKVGIGKELLYMGLLSKDEVIAKQRTMAALRRWLFRGAGFVCMWIGLSMVFSPFKAIVSFIPFASNLVEGAVGFVTFFITIILAMTTIAIAWFVVRPLLSVALLVIVVAAFLVLAKKRSTPPELPASAAPPPLPTS